MPCRFLCVAIKLTRRLLQTEYCGAQFRCIADILFGNLRESAVTNLSAAGGYYPRLIRFEHSLADNVQICTILLARERSARANHQQSLRGPSPKFNLWLKKSKHRRRRNRQKSD